MEDNTTGTTREAWIMKYIFYWVCRLLTKFIANADKLMDKAVEAEMKFQEKKHG